MASFGFFLLRNPIIYVLLSVSTPIQYAIGCYTSIISFGDSLADTGNLLHLSPSSDKLPNFALPPYGETFFHRPTGRCSDGRLIIDFIAQYLGLPFLAPYIGGKNGNSTKFLQGVNFAVSGATALDTTFLKERGIHNPVTNVSLGLQLTWFKEMLPSLCQTSSNCKKVLKSSLFLVGEIGGNDYNYQLLGGTSIEDVQSFVPSVINAIASTINELIELGAMTLVVPGNLPIGCSSAYLTQFESPNKEDYDPRTGCIMLLNNFAKYHNGLLQRELNRIRELHPHATIIYADYYNAAMQFYLYPYRHGFLRGALRACCGGGGPYNYNSSMPCGYPPSTTCDDPSLYANWDGLHLTEAAYRWIAKGLLKGQYTKPHIHTPCIAIDSGASKSSVK